MQHWFDPIAIGIVFLGTLAATVLRCGLVDARLAFATVRGLVQPAFDPVQAKAEVAKQITEIASDGFLRAEPRHFGDQEFDRLADILISQRSAASLHDEHSKYRSRRADIASRAVRFLDCAAELAPVMAKHLDVDAVWSFSDPELAEVVEREGAGNLKRTWVETTARDWMGPAGEGQLFLEAATEVKTVWVPYGA